MCTGAPAVPRQGGIGPLSGWAKARCRRRRKERVGKLPESSITEDRLVIAGLLPWRADPARWLTKPPRILGRPLAERKPTDQLPVAAAMRAGPCRELQRNGTWLGTDDRVSPATDSARGLSDSVETSSSLPTQKPCRCCATLAMTSRAGSWPQTRRPLRTARTA